MCHLGLMLPPEVQQVAALLPCFSSYTVHECLPQSVYCSAFCIFVPSVGALLFKQSPSIVMTCCLVFLEKMCVR